MENKAALRLEFNKIDKNPNASGQKWRFETVEEIFAALTPENVDRFIEAFGTCVKASVLMHAAVYEQAEISGKPLKPDALKMIAFEWIDD